MNASRHTVVPTLSASDIAQLAGVGRSTVSNWRQRHDDFPEPVSGEGNRLRYSATEIRSWLKSNGKQIQSLAGGHILWSVLDQWLGAMPLEDAGSIVSDLVTWRFVSDPASAGFEKNLPPQAQWPTLMKTEEAAAVWKQILMGMHAYESAHPELAPVFMTPSLVQEEDREGEFQKGPLRSVLNAVNSLEAADLSDAFTSFHDSITRTGRRGYDAFATSDTLVDFIATVAAGVPGPVHDPVVGSGRMLVATASRGEDRSRLTGQDINSRACLQAKQRALLDGHVNVDIRQGDVFQSELFPSGTAQVVVMDPPYGLQGHDGADLYLDPRLTYGTPPKSSMDLAWLQLAVWHLGLHGRAFVLQPPGSAFRGGAEMVIRTAMLRAGTIEAIVALPAGLASHTQIPLNLWVLARPGETADPNRVLMVDHSTAPDVDSDAVAAGLQQWRDLQTVPSDLHAEAFTVTELLAQQTNLDPRRWMAATHEAPGIEEVRAGIESLRLGISNIRQPKKLTRESIATDTQTPRMVTVTELEKADTLTTLKATGKVRQADLVYSTHGTPIVTGPWIRGDDDSQMINLDLLEEPPLITCPGDILVQNTGGLAARVDPDGGRALISTSFHLLRLKGDAFNPDYLAEFLVSAQNRNKAQGVNIQRIRLSEMVIRMIPREQQDRLIEAIAELRSLQAATRQLLAATDTTRQHIIDAFTDGTINIT